MKTTQRLFDTSGVPRPELTELLRLFHIGHDGSMRGIRDALQFAWLVPGKLRAEISDDDDRSKLPQFLPIFRSLGMVDAITAGGTYSYALVGGAKRTAVEKRIRFLTELWMDERVRFERLVLLGSGRTLMRDEESSPLRTAVESQMMLDVFRKLCSVLPWPDSLFVDATHCPKPADRNASVEDTATAWKTQFAPPIGPCLGVFSQPFVAQQALAAELALGTGFPVTGVGYEAIPSYGLRVYLDNIAKQVDVEWRLAERA